MDPDFQISVLVSKVICGDCSECCSGPNRNGVRLNPQWGDEVQRYRYETRFDGVYLKQRDDGTCVYLESNGCSIYPVRPALCRVYDCRVIADLEETPERIRQAAKLAAIRKR